MEIKKIFTISSISFKWSGASPITVNLRPKDASQGDLDSKMVLDINSAKEFGIKLGICPNNMEISAELRDGEIEVVFTKLEEGREDSGNQLSVGTLVRKEITNDFYSVPISRRTKVERSLLLSNVSGYSHPGCIPRAPLPWFSFMLDLTEEEYQQCKDLKATDVFTFEAKIIG